MAGDVHIAVMNNLTISIFQAGDRHESADARLSWMDMVAERASDSGAELLICPELTLCGHRLSEPLEQTARPAQGEYAERVGEIAFLHEIAIVFGYPEAVEGGYSNSAMFIDATGKAITNHRALYPGAGTDGAAFVPGDQALVFDYQGWKLAVLIGRDLEHPEVARHAALNGAELLVVPAALGVGREGVAEKLVPVRALENGVFVAYANWAHNNGPEACLGGSCIISPTGTTEATGGREATILEATLHKDAISEARQTQPYLAERRSFGD